MLPDVFLQRPRVPAFSKCLMIAMAMMKKMWRNLLRRSNWRPDAMYGNCSGKES
jgi:hypothetical protein